MTAAFGVGQIIGPFTDNGGNTVAIECPPDCPADLDGDGKISREEWHIFKAFMDADTNGDGKITLEEAVQAHEHRLSAQEQRSSELQAQLEEVGGALQAANEQGAAQQQAAHAAARQQHAMLPATLPMATLPGTAARTRTLLFQGTARLRGLFP